MKTRTGAVVFLLLALMLAGILWFRMRNPLTGNTDVAVEAGEDTDSDLNMQETENIGQGLPAEETAKNAIPEAAEEADDDDPVTAEPAETLPPLRPASLSGDMLPEELLLPAEHRGSVSEEEYTTRDMVSDLPYEIDKDVAVYLPWGYDPAEQYDVLILLHCAWADHRFWLVQERNYGTETDPIPVSVSNLLDRMIEEGWCRPLIVLSPCIYLYDRQPSTAGNPYDYAQFTMEFGTNFLPWVVENYATYARDGSREAIREAREHFGVLGASFGAYASYISVIGDNFDLAAWYTFCGGGEIDPGYLLNSWSRTGTEMLPLKMLYICEGEFDDRAGPELSYYALLNTGGAFNGDNVRFTLVQGWGHEDHSYLVGLFNSLQLFFRDGNAEEPR